VENSYGEHRFEQIATRVAAEIGAAHTGKLAIEEESVRSFVQPYLLRKF
jgi:hypothetical protein